ncbi:MAG: BatD family protein [Lentisphaeria bacterium]
MAGIVLLIAGNASAVVKAVVSPETLLVGETGQFIVTSDQGVPDEFAVPQVAGIRWGMGSSVQMRNINGRTIGRRSRRFLVEKAGTYIIPAIRVEVDGEMQATEPIKIKVHELKKGKLSLSEMAYLKIKFDGASSPPAQLYPGQQLPMQIKVYVRENTNPQLGGYPKIEMGEVSFRDYSQVNNRNSRFARPRQARRVIDGVAFRVITFQTVVTPLKLGTVDGKITVQTALTIPDEGARNQGNDRGFDQSLLNEFFDRRGRRVQRRLVFDIPPIEIIQLPEVPDEAGAYLGLVGDWKLDFTINQKEVKVGEAITAKLTIEGQGETRSLDIAKPNLANFRIYEPEIEHGDGDDQGQATVTWALIPLKPGTSDVKVKFCTFNPDEGQYEPYTFSRRFQITAATGGEGVPVLEAGQGDFEGKEDNVAAQQRQNAILYLKTDMGTAVWLPLWQNVLWPAGVLCLIGVAGCAALFIAANRRDRLRDDAEYRRRKQVIDKRKQIFKHLQQCSAEELPVIIRNELVPYLNAKLGLSPGTTISSLAAQLKPRDPELAKWLKAVDENAFVPEGGRLDNDEATGVSSVGGDGEKQFDVARLLNSVKRLKALLLLSCLGGGLLFCPHLLRADENSDAGTVIGDREKVFEKAVAAYDRSDYAQAQNLFEELSSPDRPNPKLLYNRGNCAYLAGNHTQALVFYERARRLSPRDTKILENLNFVRRELGLAAEGQSSSPVQILIRIRDYLRPDEWILAGALAVAVFGIGAGWLRWRQRNWRACMLIASVLVFTVVYAVRTQYRTTYRRNSQGIIADNQADAYRLPQLRADKASVGLRAGEKVVIREVRTDWYRISVEDAQAWVPRKDLLVIW